MTAICPSLPLAPRRAVHPKCQPHREVNPPIHLSIRALQTRHRLTCPPMAAAARTHMGYGCPAATSTRLSGPEWCRHRDTVTIPACGMRSSPRGAPKERGRGPAAHSITLMWPLVIVGLREGLENALLRRPAREVAPTGGHAPMLLQDLALQSLDEAIGPREARLRAGVPETEGPQVSSKPPLNSGSRTSSRPACPVEVTE
jgi:hypothetical protein